MAHDTRFHDTILAASGNPVVRHAFAQTHCHLHTFRLYPADVDGAITVAEHSAVTDAIEACLPEEAEAAMAGTSATRSTVSPRPSRGTLNWRRWRTVGRPGSGSSGKRPLQVRTAGPGHVAGAFFCAAAAWPEQGIRKSGA